MSPKRLLNHESSVASVNLGASGNPMQELFNFITPSLLSLQFLNWSAPSDKPLIPPGTQASDKSVRTKIRDKMKMADCVLVLGGMYAAHSDWMQAEIDIAKALPRTIIGIRPRGNKPYPTNVLVASKVDVNWSTSSIVEAIRSNARPR